MLLMPSKLEFDQFPQQIACFDGLANMTAQVVFEKGLGRVKTVDARHRGHHDAIGPRHQGRHGSETLLFDALVDAQFLVDVQIPLRKVGFRLVVVVV